MITANQMTAEKMKKIELFLLGCMLALFLTGCSAKKVEYEIDISGEAEESGVISYLGYEMNVYQDESSNPCGTCAYQPVSFYVGASADEVCDKLAEAIERADDVWDVVSHENGVLVVREREAGSVKQIPGLESVQGLTMTGKVLQGKVEVLAGSSGSASGTSSTESEEMTDPQRIAAVYGPSYEMLKVLGVEDRIVVRADVQTDTFPWAEEVFPRITSIPYLDNVHTAVNFEELMTYSPDMVYSFPRPSEEKQLSEAGVAYLAGKSAKMLEDTPQQLMTYAKTINEDAVAKARAYGQYYSQKIEMIREVTNKLEDSERPKVYYAGMDILTTYGAYSDMPEVIQAAGGICVSEDLKAGSRTQIDYEQLMEWNPDVVFIDHGGINGGDTVERVRQEMLSGQQYAQLAAVENDAVYLVPSGVFYWDMGLQKVLLVMNMAKTLYPDKFEDLDMAREVQEFYQTFYDYPLTREQAEKILNREAP